MTACGADDVYTPKYQEGTLKEEFGTYAALGESSGALFGNESVKIEERKYGLVVDTPEGEYTIVLQDGYSSNCKGRSKSLFGLAKKAEQGDYVKFRTDYTTSHGRKLDYFSADKIGKLPTCHVEILPDIEDRLNKDI